MCHMTKNAHELSQLRSTSSNVRLWTNILLLVTTYYKSCYMFKYTTTIVWKMYIQTYNLCSEEYVPVCGCDGLIQVFGTTVCSSILVRFLLIEKRGTRSLVATNITTTTKKNLNRMILMIITCHCR